MLYPPMIGLCSSTTSPGLCFRMKSAMAWYVGLLWMVASHSSKASSLFSQARSSWAGARGGVLVALREGPPVLYNPILFFFYWRETSRQASKVGRRR